MLYCRKAVPTTNTFGPYCVQYINEKNGFDIILDIWEGSVILDKS